MKKKTKGVSASTALRRQAEARLLSERRVGRGRRTADETQRLVHELQVHQIELELQNEELQRARTELEAGLARYTDLYDFAPVGYVTLGRDGKIVSVNLTGARLLGFPRSRLVGGRFGSFVTNDCRAAFNGFLERAFTGGTRQSCEVALAAEGHALWVQIEATVSEDGRECRAVLVNVTERRRIEETLRFRMTLLDYAATHAIGELLQYTLDAVGALTESPVGFYHFVEPDQQTLSLQAWSTHTMRDLCPPAGEGRHYPLGEAGIWADCVRERQPIIHNGNASQPHRKELPEGYAAVTRELVVPVMRSGRVVAVAGVGNKPADYTDIDVEVVSHFADVAWHIIERKRVEGALKESEQRYHEVADALREVDHNRALFLAMLSHELRNPLAPIRNSVYILANGEPGGDEAKRACTVIERQVGHLTRLIDDLLDVTRISRGKFQLRRQSLDLRDLVLRAADDHRPAFATSGVELTVVAGDDAVWVHGDPTRLTQAVGNLLSNAAKFTQRGGRALLTLERDAPAAQAVVRVRDTGAGIAAGMLPRVFEPFAQGKSTLDRSHGGLGLGLALVKGLVEMHEGAVSAHSDGAGSGALFTIRLPLREGAREPAAASQTAPDRVSRRVLVIEDNVDAADTLREVLALSGHDVAVAYGSHEGVTKARALKPDVVICDIGLPEMDGYEVARALRADPALGSTCLVALTGYAQPEDVVRAQQAGFDLHLAKPPSLEKLRRVVEVSPVKRPQDAGPPPATDPTSPGPPKVGLVH